jgi:phage FluMu protein Com
MEPTKTLQVCSKCGHVQCVKIWGQLRWSCGTCKRLNDIKTDINMKEMV